MNKELEVIGLVDYIFKFLENQDLPIKIGLAYNRYIESNNIRLISYKTFQRNVEELAERELIVIKKIIGGAYGTTTLIKEIIKKNDTKKTRTNNK